MSGGGVEAEWGRARPLSGGLWTLFSWLRRDEHSSTESVSSAGSDRTAASFAFLAPALYGRTGVAPAPRAPPSPPTDSYRRRVRERGLRRQRERDLTLHRKYGLYGLGYDAASLPLASAIARRPEERDRRAASESPRAHVPGKRRAPPPPVSAAATLPRRRARKRPAPLPPSSPRLPDLPAAPMSRPPAPDERPPRGRDEAPDCKSEKYSKKDTQTKETKDTKIRHEKSFLKHIFENKKRNSAIETSSVKLLPNISELDKQAAEMIEKYRLKEMTPSDAPSKGAGKEESAGASSRQAEAWICTRCLRKYDSSVITCNYCLPINKNNDSYKGSKMSNSGTQTKCNLSGVAPGSSRANLEDKEKLKEILKEMKDSLPKRPKSELILSNKINNRESDIKDDYPKIAEAATLRIGSSICMDKKPAAEASTSGVVTEQSTSKLIPQNTNKANGNTLTTINSVIITQPVVLVHTKESNVVINESKVYNGNSSQLLPVNNKPLRENPNLNVTEVERMKKDANVAINESKVNKDSIQTQPINNVKYLRDGPTVNVIEIERMKETNVTVNESKAKKENSVQLLPIRPLKDCPNSNIAETEKKPINDPKPLHVISKTRYDLNTPLKISSLLNPIYIPKTTSTTNTETKLVKQAENKNQKANSPPKPLLNTSEKMANSAVVPTPKLVSVTLETNKDNESVTLETNNKTIPDTKKKSDDKVTINEKNTYVPINATTENIKEKTKTDLVINNPQNVDQPSTSRDNHIDQHARRRDLISQLERSIAKGDEKAAAEAAVKLAQLKLSCSVLSFSSQIVAEAPTSSLTTPQQTNVVKLEDNIKKNESNKVEEVIQTSSVINVQQAQAVPAKEITENVFKRNFVNHSDEKKQPVPLKENVQLNESPKPNVSVLPKVESTKQIQSTEVKNSSPSVASTSKDISPKKENDDEEVPILVWVEDREATRGPVQLHVRRGAALGELRRRAERALGLAARLQRWIVGRALCCDDAQPLRALAGPDLAAPFYLCLVDSDAKTVQKVKVEAKEDPGNVYNELVNLEKQPLVSNTETFECGVCIEECRPGSGVVLRECVHSFCKECLSDVVRHSEEAVVSCPATGCRGVLQEREVRGLVSAADHERWLARGLAAAESGTRNAFHCRTRDCSGWALCDPGVRRFPCPVCKRTNCIPCQAIHEGESCDQHRAKQESAAGADASQTDEGTRALLTSLIARGEALECPECSAIITKKWGCDWIKCSACKTEICWVTRGRRWGPAGRGDTSAGCRCGVDGKRCHPSCGYCH